MSSQTESFDVTTNDGRVMRITIDRRELASTMLFRLNKDRASYKGGRTKPTKVVALEGGVKAEWVSK
jgi:hypothetical protein